MKTRFILFVSFTFLVVAFLIVGCDKSADITGPDMDFSAFDKKGKAQIAKAKLNSRPNGLPIGPNPNNREEDPPVDPDTTCENPPCEETPPVDPPPPAMPSGLDEYSEIMWQKENKAEEFSQYLTDNNPWAGWSGRVMSMTAVRDGFYSIKIHLDGDASKVVDLLFEPSEWLDYTSQLSKLDALKVLIAGTGITFDISIDRIDSGAIAGGVTNSFTVDYFDPPIDVVPPVDPDPTCENPPCEENPPVDPPAPDMPSGLNGYEQIVWHKFDSEKTAIEFEAYLTENNPWTGWSGKVHGIGDNYIVVHLADNPSRIVRLVFDAGQSAKYTKLAQGLDYIQAQERGVKITFNINIENVERALITGPATGEFTVGFFDPLPPPPPTTPPVGSNAWEKVVWYKINADKATFENYITSNNPFRGWQGKLFEISKSNRKIGVWLNNNKSQPVYLDVPEDNQWNMFLKRGLPTGDNGVIVDFNISIYPDRVTSVLIYGKADPINRVDNYNPMPTGLSEFKQLKWHKYNAGKTAAQFADYLEENAPYTGWRGKILRSQQRDLYVAIDGDSDDLFRIWFPHTEAGNAQLAKFRPEGIDFQTTHVFSGDTPYINFDIKLLPQWFPRTTDNYFIGEIMGDITIEGGWTLPEENTPPVDPDPPIDPPAPDMPSGLSDYRQIVWQKFSSLKSDEEFSQYLKDNNPWTGWRGRVGRVNIGTVNKRAVIYVNSKSSEEIQLNFSDEDWTVFKSDLEALDPAQVEKRGAAITFDITVSYVGATVITGLVTNSFTVDYYDPPVEPDPPIDPPAPTMPSGLDEFAKVQWQKFNSEKTVEEFNQYLADNNPWTGWRGKVVSAVYLSTTSGGAQKQYLFKIWINGDASKVVELVVWDTNWDRYSSYLSNLDPTHIANRGIAITFDFIIRDVSQGVMTGDMGALVNVDYYDPAPPALAMPSGLDAYAQIQWHKFSSGKTPKEFEAYITENNPFRFWEGKLFLISESNQVIQVWLNNNESHPVYLDVPEKNQWGLFTDGRLTTGDNGPIVTFHIEIYADRVTSNLIYGKATPILNVAYIVPEGSGLKQSPPDDPETATGPVMPDGLSEYKQVLWHKYESGKTPAEFVNYLKENNPFTHWLGIVKYSEGRSLGVLINGNQDELLQLFIPNTKEGDRQLARFRPQDLDSNTRLDYESNNAPSIGFDVILSSAWIDLPTNYFVGQLASGIDIRNGWQVPAPDWVKSMPAGLAKYDQIIWQKYDSGRTIEEFEKYISFNNPFGPMNGKLEWLTLDDCFTCDGTPEMIILVNSDDTKSLRVWLTDSQADQLDNLGIEDLSRYDLERTLVWFSLEVDFEGVSRDQLTGKMVGKIDYTRK